MQIDKIEICNLTSIEGEQVIDFTKEPLKSAGLFAITGNTGAGKSTILDAICLALYNEAPRLGNREHTAKAADDSPNIFSTCNMLRRGTTLGYSKITFSLDDNSQYMASWTVSLNRNNKFKPILRELIQQKPRHTTIATGNRDVQTELLNILKLDYNQFTRTVILAQNSFTNFLSAKKGEKSQLLEKITGTEIYAGISRQIFLQTKEAEKEYIGACQHMEGLSKGTLTEEDLSRAHEDLNLLESLQGKYEDEQKRTNKQIEWYELHHKASGELKEKKEELHVAQQAFNAMFDQQRELHRYDSLQPFAPTYLAIKRVEEEISQYKNATSNRQEQANQIKQEMEDCQSKHNDALTHLLNARQILSIQQPNIDQGRRIEGQLATTKNTLQETKEELLRHDNELSLRRDTYNGKEAELKDCETRLNNARLAKQTMIQHQVMISQIELVRTRLEKMNTMRLDIESAQNSLAKSNSRLLLLKDGKIRLEEEARELQNTIARLKAELLIHEQANKGLNSGEIQLKLNHLATIAMRSGDAINLWKRIDRCYNEISEKTDELRRRRTQNRQKEIEIKEKQIRLKVLEETYEQIHRNYTLSQSEDIINMRQELKEGSPCPLCGSTHHPFHSDSEQHFDQLLENLTEQHRQAQDHLLSIRRQLEELLSAYNDEQGRLDAEEQFLQRIINEQKDNIVAWQAFVDLDSAFCKCDENVNRVHRHVILRQINESATREHDDVKRILIEFNKHQDEINRINTEIQSTQQLMTDNTRQKAEVVAECNAEESKIASTQESIVRTRDSLTEEMARIDPIMTLSGWKERWRTSYEALDHELQVIKTRWDTCCETVMSEEKSLFRLQQELSAMTSGMKDLQVARQTLQNKTDMLIRQIDKYKEELHTLFGDSTVDEEATRLTKAVDRANEEVQTAQAVYNKTKERLNTLNGEIQSLKQQYADYEKEHQQLRTQLDLDISRFNSGQNSTLQYFELDKYFSNPQDWAKLRTTIDELKSNLEAATFRADVANQAIVSLEQSPFRPEENNPEDSKTALLSKKEELKTQIQKNQEELRHCEYLIKAHQDSKNQMEKYKPKLDKATENYTHWKKLCDVLGSADGKAFREIAQCYTFEFLVDFANHQLADLTSRYKLRTKPGTLQLEVIDRHMLDQVRAVNSLSGGESFIVSLSLALGLSSLSGSNLNIGSLFIDEGFGNLDAQNLDMVIDALSNLQNTQRRKVGVISHTEQIRSRISPKIHLLPEPGGRSVITVKG